MLTVLLTALSIYSGAWLVLVLGCAVAGDRKPRRRKEVSLRKDNPRSIPGGGDGDPMAGMNPVVGSRSAVRSHCLSQLVNLTS